MFRAILLFLLSLCSFGQVEAKISAVSVLNTIPYSYAVTPIIDKNEWKELQLDRLVTVLDRTQTAFGKWGLTHLLHPVSDQKEIEQRQKIIVFLVENPKILHHFQKQLNEIKKYEDSLLAYWDPQDQLNADCEQFYYALPGLRKRLNKSPLALNLGVATQMVDAGKSLLMSLCLQGVSDEVWAWTTDKQESFNLWSGLQRGFTQPWRQHSFALDLLKDKASREYTLKDWVSVGTRGSFGDRYEVLSQGMFFDAEALGLPKQFSHQATKAVGLFAKSLAFTSASLQTLAYDYFWGVSLVSILRRIAFMHQSLKDLTKRVLDVTSCCNAMGHVMSGAQEYRHIFGKYVYCDTYHDVALTLMHDLVKKQRSENYLYNYSLGHSLAMHREIKGVKSAFVPVLQIIALLDGYCSMAQLYKEHANKKNRFSFVTFVNKSKSYIVYENAWLALLTHDKAVANNIYLGNQHASKIIITGPNGGGKSTLLKTVGVSAVLAQSCGMVPADHAEQTLFASIKTGLAPHENLQQGLSTFMAEKKCMEYLEACIKKAQKNNMILALIDEPYKGTVDDESAKRIYNFGMSIVQNPYALVCIATHVKKPILLAADTGGLFANYHVEIVEEALGRFKLLFTLKQGPATWWFEDEEKRGRFVDWINTLLEK